MISNVLKSIDGITIYPIISLLLFVIAFAGIVIYAVRMKKEAVDRMSRLPLNESE